MTDEGRPQPPNLLTMIPAPAVESEIRDGLAVLLLPRTPNRFLARIFPPARRPRVVKIHLDEFGSFVWSAMDGRRTVYDIAAALRERFGGDVEPVYERLGLFINLLARRRLISLHP